jgi:prevent-host-death family protein
MQVNATEFRRNLFGVLERVLDGEPVEILYKGSSVRLVPAVSSSKLARAKRQNTLLCDPDSIVQADKTLSDKMEAEWRRDWKKL